MLSISRQADRPFKSRNKETKQSSPTRSLTSHKSRLAKSITIERGEGLNKPIMSTHGFKYECMIQGPIMLTAPHSTKILRGRGIKGEKERVHKKESWVNYIAIRLAYYLTKLHNAKKKDLDYGSIIKNPKIASFMIWNKTKKYNDNDVDPNFLTKELFPKSLFYQAIRYWLVSLNK